MSVVEVRALKALYRNHPATPPNMRYSAATRRNAFANRDMLLAWAASQPDYALLDCRNLGTASLAWIREQTADPKSPFADLEEENAALRAQFAEAVAAERARIRAAVEKAEHAPCVSFDYAEVVDRVAVLAIIDGAPDA